MGEAFREVGEVVLEPKILKAHGFTQEDLDEGWKFLRAVAGVRLDFIQNEQTVDPLQLRRLDDWENKWFPIISATLNRRYPDLHKAVFLNLTQTQGPAVILSVSTLLKRLKESEKTAEGKAARKLLESRGVTKPVIADAEDMVEKLSSFAEVPEVEPVDEEALDAAQAQAVDAMWGSFHAPPPDPMIRRRRNPRLAQHSRRALTSPVHVGPPCSRSRAGLSRSC